MVAIVGCLVLSGCSPTPPILPGEREPTAAPTAGFLAQVAAEGAEGITVTWLKDSSDVVVTTMGSSGCPLVPSENIDSPPHTLVLVRDTAGASDCPADINPTSTTIERPAGWDVGILISARYTDQSVYLIPK